MQDAPNIEPEPKNLRFLRILVTVLTATMIIGILSIFALIVIRFSGETTGIVLPNDITLPDGTVVTAFTKGSDWFAIVTQGDEILIFDAKTMELRQTIEILAAPDQNN